MHMDKTPPGRSTPPPRWPPRGPVRVLLVLDQPLVVQLIKLTLGHGPYDVRTTAVGAEALATLATWQPHLVLVDMDLEPGGILNQITATPAASRLPIIALTRRGNLTTKLAAFDSGADDI